MKFFEKPVGRFQGFRPGSELVAPPHRWPYAAEYVHWNVSHITLVSASMNVDTWRRSPAV